MVAPAGGMVFQWHMLGGDSSFQYRLQVLSQGPGGTYTATGFSAPSVPSGPELQTFSTAIPIQAGQVVAIELEAGAPLAYAPTPGASFDRLVAPLALGVPGTATPGSSFELGFNAVVAAPPIGPPATPVAAAPAQVTAPAACRVPNLVGKRLAAAKNRIRKAGCKVGTVKRLEGGTARTGVVVKQNPKAGKILAPGAKVKLTLGR